MSTAQNQKKPAPPLHDQQFNVLRRIWEHGDSGYVFLPWIPAEVAFDDASRKANWNQGRAFRWPDDADAIKVHLQEHAGDEQYFSASKFKDKNLGPKQENALDAAVLFADLDAVDPRSLDDDLKPTIAWETSPGSYQAAWLLGEDSTRPGEHDHGGLNHRLTEHTGADRGGWFANKMLRVPGSTHNKGEPTPGKVLWKSAGRFSWEDLDSRVEPLPKKLQIEKSVITQDVLDHVKLKRAEITRKARARGFPRKMLAELKAEPIPDKGERSLMMWAVAKELAKAGCDLVEIIALVQGSRWNKHDGQPQELARLLDLGSKAIGDLTPEEAEHADREITVPAVNVRRANVRAFMKRAVRPPGFLVKGLIPDTGCGWVAGPPKNYKSWLALDAAVSISSGQKLLDLPTQSGVVVVIQAEDPIHRIQQRLDMVYAGKPDHKKQPRGSVEVTANRLRWSPMASTPGELYVYYQPDFKLGHDEWMVWLEEVIEETGADLVIIDNLIKVLPPGTDIDKINVKEPLESLKAMMEEYSCALGIIHHAPKTSETNVGLLGSVALHAWADWGIYFKSKSTKDGRTVARFYAENKDALEDSIAIDVSALNGGPRELVEFEGEVGYVQDQPGVWAPRVLVSTDDEDDGGKPKKESASDRDRRRVVEYVQTLEPGMVFGRSDISGWELGKDEAKNKIITGLAEDAKIPVRLANAGDEVPDGRGKYWVVTG